MITIAHTVTIARRVPDVFSFVADLENLPQWQSEVVTSTVTTPGPTRVGTRFTEEVKIVGKKVPTACEVTDFVPDQRIGFTAASPAIDYHGLFTVSDNTNQATDVTLKASVQLKSWFRLVAPLFAREVRNGARKELETLKQVLEAA